MSIRTITSFDLLFTGDTCEIEVKVKKYMYSTLIVNLTELITVNPLFMSAFSHAPSPICPSFWKNPKPGYWKRQSRLKDESQQPTLDNFLKQTFIRYKYMTEYSSD